MALTIYPLDNYDTFCLLADAETILLNNVPIAQRASWDALTDIVDGLTADEQKEIYLRQATMLILSRIPTENLPTTLESDLQKACALLANHSVGIDMQKAGEDYNIKRKKVDVIEKEYFYQGQPQNAFPDVVLLLLKQYEVSTSGSFSFARA